MSNCVRVSRDVRRLIHDLMESVLLKINVLKVQTKNLQIISNDYEEAPENLHILRLNFDVIVFLIVKVSHKIIIL